MRKPAWLVLGSLLVSSFAFAAGKSGRARLGTFTGTNYVIVATHEGQRPQTEHPETVKLRVNGGRLYVTQHGGAWVQSFKVTGDFSHADGARTIHYRRDTGKVGQRNEARLDAAQADNSTGYRGLSGHGTVSVTRDGRVQWQNRGQARIQGFLPERGKVDFPVAWSELFQGSR